MKTVCLQWLNSWVGFAAMPRYDGWHDKIAWNQQINDQQCPTLPCGYAAAIHAIRSFANQK